MADARDPQETTTRPAGRQLAADPQNATARPAGGIVVGIDGSPGSTAALRWAVEEASRCGAPVTALLVWDAMGEPRPVFDAASNADRPGLARAARQVLDSTLARVQAEDPTVTVTGVVEEGSPVPELVRGAARARLLVVGERGHGALHRLVAGSVSQGVVHHATVPVVVVRGDGEDHEGPRSQGVDERPVVVGIDGSAPSLRALRWAVDAATERKTGLRVVHAWHLDIAVYPGMYEGFWSTLADRARHTLDETVATVARERGGELPIPVRGETVADGAARALLRSAADAQLLVVGSRGHGGFAELLLGSVSHQCVTHAPCPVAVIR
jgi:nucleotide-binding universal stress UspA family protein